MHPELGWILLGLAVAAGVIGLAAPTERRRIRYTAILTGTALLMWMTARLPNAPLSVGESAMALAQIVAIHLGALLLFNVLLRRLHVPRLVSDIAIGAGYAVVLLGLLSRVGVNLTGIIATSAVLTAVIGFSVQDMLANLVGGVVLEVERSILAGDWIKTDQGVGQVRDVRLRHTAIETPDGDTVIIPNRSLTLSPVTVLGRVQESAYGVIKHRRLISFFLSYGHSPIEVTEAVEQALAASPLDGVASTPLPRCVVLGYHQHAVEYATLTWMTRPGMDLVDSSGVRARIHYALARLGVPMIPIVQPVELHHGPTAGLFAVFESDSGTTSALPRTDVLMSTPCPVPFWGVADLRLIARS